MPLAREKKASGHSRSGGGEGAWGGSLGMGEGLRFPDVLEIELRWLKMPRHTPVSVKVAPPMDSAPKCTREHTFRTN